MFYSNLAIHSLYSNHKQYRSLFLVCIIGVGLILSSIALSDGMIKTVRYKSKQYYGGDLQFLGGWAMGTTEADDEILKLRQYVPEYVKIFKRYDYDGEDNNVKLFFEGASVNQRLLKGVDFEEESELFDKFKFTEGGAYSTPGHDTIIISRILAEKLGISAGDRIVVQGTTEYGSINTIELLLTGVFQDTSLFGMYTSYLDIHALRNLTMSDSEFVNRISMFYGDKSPDTNEIIKLNKALSNDFNMFPYTKNKKEFLSAFYRKDEPLWGLISLDSNLPEMEMLIDALRIIVTVVSLVLIMIISIGIGSTYKVIVMKRIAEIGTYRALGMKPTEVTCLFVVESSFLMVVSFVIGLFLSVVIAYVLSMFDFSFIPAFDMFLMKGKLAPSFAVGKGFCILAVIYLATQINVVFTIRKAVHISPVGALATTN